MPGSIDNEEVLSRAQEGLTVYDVDQELLGTVSEVFMGSAEEYDPIPVEVPAVGLPSQPTTSTLGTLGGTGQARDFENEFPTHVRAALLRQGCIKVKGGGVFGPVWYVTPDQVKAITAKEMSLKVPGREVIRSR